MKLKYFIAALATSASLCAPLSSCTDDFESTNTDPNKMPVGDMNPYGLFEATFYGMANRQLYLTWAYNDELVQYTACTGSNGKDFHRYSFNNNNVETVWNNYARYAANAAHMAELGEKKGQSAIQAVATTLKVFCMANLTDLFGDIPYEEAFRYDEEIWAPKFDSQKDIYNAMFAELEAANTIYSKDPAFSEPSIDLMYGGDITLWRKFNNSLYLRLLMRVSGRPEMAADTKIAKIVSNPSKYPIFTSNADNATVKFTGFDPYYNYFHTNTTTETQFSKGSYKLTNTIIGLTVISGINSEEDPRLAIIGYKNGSEGDWNGVQGGCSLSDARVEDAGSSYLNYPVLAYKTATDKDPLAQDGPAYLMDYAEVQFILAEAALKGFIDGGEPAAKKYYEEALTASCQKWGEFVQYSSRKFYITDTVLSNFLKGRLAGWDNNEDHARLIAEQKYLALFWVGFEAYHELRRTGYPVITIGNGCSYNNYEYPQRLFYPTNTVGSNSTHVQEALERMGGENTLRTPLWWSYMAINGSFTAVRQK